jgi:hypothetical protein
MRNRIYPILASGALILSILACNLPGGQSTTQLDLAATITAQALALQVSGNTAVPLDTPSNPQTSTPSTPQVTVSSPTNCRTGPSTNYDLIFTMNPGQSLEVVGKNTPTNYLIIKNPIGGTCWLWTQYATVTGDISGLPEFPIPPEPTPKFTKTPKSTSTPKPTHTPAPPTSPSGLTQTRDCAGGFRGITPIWIETVTISWQDNADNETGYRLYKNNTAVPDLGPNTTEYHITLRYDQGTGGALYDNFGVEAFNDTGSSSRPSVDVPRCP